jgi:hypothetical protein
MVVEPAGEGKKKRAYAKLASPFLGEQKFGSPPNKGMHGVTLSCKKDWYKGSSPQCHYDSHHKSQSHTPPRAQTKFPTRGATPASSVVVSTR